jgi:hypothetical protein
MRIPSRSINFLRLREPFSDLRGYVKIYTLGYDLENLRLP